MVRKLARDRLEDLRNAVPFIFIVLAQILLVEVEDRPLNSIDAGEVIALDEKLYRLRHAADGHVGAEVTHDAAVDGVGQGLAQFERLSDCWHGYFVVFSPEEFLEIHGVHLRSLFFRRYEDILHVLAYRDERTGLDVVVAPVFHKSLDSLAGRRIELNLVEYDDGVALGQALSLQQKQVSKERVEITDIVKVLAHVDSVEREVDEQIVGIVLLRKSLCNGTLPNAPCALNQQCCSAIGDLFPFCNSVVRFALEKGRHCPSFAEIDKC